MELDKELESSGQTALCDVEFPIRRMIAEHDGEDESLAGMRAVSRGSEPPSDARLSYSDLNQGLEEFERDLHRQIHLENNTLFPRVLALPGLSQEAEHVG